MRRTDFQNTNFILAKAKCRYWRQKKRTGASMHALMWRKDQQLKTACRPHSRSKLPEMASDSHAIKCAAGFAEWMIMEQRVLIQPSQLVASPTRQ